MRTLRTLLVAPLLVGLGCQVIGGIHDIDYVERLPCAITSDCPKSNVCIVGGCSVQCREDADCGEGRQCLTIQGGAGCVSPSDNSCSAGTKCPAGTKCQSGKCQTACTAPSDCRDEQVCIDGVCVSGGAPDSSVTSHPDAGSGGSSGGGGAGGVSGAGGGLGTGGIDSGVPDAGPALPPCVDGEVLLDDNAVYVAPASLGGGVGNTGTRQSPFDSLAAAVTRAKSGNYPTIYLAPGAYKETVSLSALASNGNAGLTIRGGWQVQAQTWTRDCSPTARQETVVQPADAGKNAPTLTFSGALGKTTLQSFTIQSKPVPHAAAAGEDGDTLIGVYVAPTATGSLGLVDMIVKAGIGGDAGNGTPLTGPSSSGACDGTHCADSVSVDGAGGEEPDHGFMTPDGFVPGHGGVATPGTFGNEGTAGGSPQSLACVECINVVGSCAKPTVGVAVGSPGLCGCGGPNARIGGPGGGGGASIGLYVGGGSAKVTVLGSALQASHGGRGGAGTAPDAAGFAGTSGTQGASSAPCVASCNSSCSGLSGTAAGGTKGGAGGPGGKSGKSGDGSGGPSFALVVVGGGSVTTKLSDLTFGAGGVDPSAVAAQGMARYDQASCGNGQLDPGEQCDDANHLDDDACSNGCKVNCSGAGLVLDPANGRCYQETAAQRTHTGAVSECLHLGPGWKLATFGTTENAVFAATRLGILPNAHVFIDGTANGGTRAATSGWTTTGDTLPDPLVWASGEPNNTNGNENCLMISGSSASGLLDANCASPHIALCERIPPNWQLETCGNGRRDGIEECDDGNPTDTDTCASCVMQCPDGLLDLASRHCSKVVDLGAQETFAAARATCKAIGAGWDLLVSTDGHEFSLVSSGGGNQQAGAWIGATNDPTLVTTATNTAWKWVDGTAVNATTFSQLTTRTAAQCAMVRKGDEEAMPCTSTAEDALCQQTIP